MITTWRWVYVLMGMILALTLTTTTVFAVGLDDAINQVNQEYSNGKITDKTVRDNLILMLNDAKTAQDPDEYGALVEAYKIMVWAQTGEKIVQEAVDRLLSQAAGL